MNEPFNQSILWSQTETITSQGYKGITTGLWKTELNDNFILVQKIKVCTYEAFHGFWENEHYVKSLQGCQKHFAPK